MPAHLLEHALAPEGLRHRDGVGRLPALEQMDHRPEDLPVRLLVELLGDQELDGPREQARLEQDGAEHRPLRLEALRRDLAGELDRGGHAGRRRAADYSALTVTVSAAVTSPWRRTGTL